MITKVQLWMNNKFEEKFDISKMARTSFIHLGILIVVSLTLNLYGINWGLPHKISPDPQLSANEVDWAPDSLAPLKPLAYARSLLYQEPWLNKYPPFHFLILALVYSPYVLFLFLTGELISPAEFYPYGLKNPELSLTVFTLISRITTVLMSTGLAIGNYYAVGKFYDKRPAFIASLLLVSSYPIIHYSHNANIDIPHLLWMVLALYGFIGILKSFKMKYYIFFSIFSAISFCTKESIYAFFLGFIPALVFYHVKYHIGTMKGMGKISSILFDRKPLISILAFFVIVLVLFNPFFNWDGIIYHFDTQSLKAFRGNVEIREASSAFYGDINLIRSYVEYICEANGLLVFLVLLVGSIYCCLRFPDRFWIFITPMVTYYIFFLRLHGTHHLRYILPVFLILTWHAGKILADILEFKRIPKPLAKALVLLILCSSIIYGFSVDVLYARDPRYELERWIETNIPAEALTLAVKPGYSLPRFRSGQNVNYRTLWDYNGNQIADIVDLDPEYIVISMAIQRRQERREEVENFFTNRGYQPMATFHARVPFYGVDIEDLRAVNPEIVVLKRSANKQGRPESLQEMPNRSR